MKPRRLNEASGSRKGNCIMFAIPNGETTPRRNPSAFGHARQGSRYGRFLQADPISYAGGLNLYAYVGNDPVNWTDPDGLAKNDIVITWRPKPQNPNEGTRTGTFGPAGSFDRSGMRWTDSPRASNRPKGGKRGKISRIASVASLPKSMTFWRQEAPACWPALASNPSIPIRVPGAALP